MRRCPDREKLIAYAANCEEAQAGLTLHLGDCARCREFVARIATIAALAGGAEAYLEPTADLSETEQVFAAKLFEDFCKAFPRIGSPGDTVPRLLAAQTTPPGVEEGNAACHCLLVEPATGRGFVIPVWVHVRESDTPGVRGKGSTDRIMQAAATRAIESAFDQLRKFGFREARPERFEVNWWLDDLSIRYEGASLGLAIALATVAAYTGASVDPTIGVTGGVDGDRVVAVQGIGSKWSALKATGYFQTMLIPTMSLPELPIQPRLGNDLHVIAVNTLSSAIAEVFGPALGLATMLTSTELQQTSVANRVGILLWVQRDNQTERTRDISVESPETSFSIGDRIRIGAQVDHDCHLALINVGTTGSVTILWPNSNHPESAVSARASVYFPSDSDRFSFRLDGPPGRERVIAIASQTPLLLTPREFQQVDEVCANPTTRDITLVAESLRERLIGRSEIQFFVVGSADVSGDLLRSTRRAANGNVGFQSFELG